MRSEESGNYAVILSRAFQSNSCDQDGRCDCATHRRLDGDSYEKWIKKMTHRFVNSRQRLARKPPSEEKLIS
jgi:hypothetical protein